METVSALANVTAVVIATMAATIALLQLRRGRMDAKAARIAELSWNIYQTYDSKRVRIGRYHLELIAAESPVPTSGAEFKAMYRSSPYVGPNQASVRRRAGIVSGVSLRAILRYYQQVGILLDQKLIDEDFVLPLIGPGLETSAEAIRAIVEYYQTFYGGAPGREAGPPRAIYQNAVTLTELYSTWKRSKSLS